MNYRKIERSDIDKLIILRKSQLLDEGFNPVYDIDNEIREYFSDNIENETFFGWVANNIDEIVSTAGACIMKRPPSFTNPTGELVYVTNVYTKDEYRRQGLATKLVTLVLEDARSRGYSFAQLHASEDGKSVYERLGFHDALGFMTKRI
jgi:ribosomal protein S18 acetylase RimI-like enzyme